MPLVLKATKDSSLLTIMWCCCLPCQAIAGLILCLCCRYDKGLSCCLPPSCTDKNPVEDHAGSIASRALSFLFETPPEKLTALKTNTWDPTIIFSSILHPLHRVLYSQLSTTIFAILDQYNLGESEELRSANLSKESIDYISKEFKTAIFEQLPNAEQFHRDYNNQIHDEEKASLDGYLTGHILKIITNEFVQTQLGIISDKLAMRLNNESVEALRQMVSQQRGVIAGVASPLQPDHQALGTNGLPSAPTSYSVVTSNPK